MRAVRQAGQKPTQAPMTSVASTLLEPAMTSGDLVLLERLVDNALQYNTPGGDLFEPFQRLQGRTASDGFGFGLAIVTAHQGTVTAEPRPGGGLTVTVTIPRLADRAEQRSPRSRPASLTSTPRPAPVPQQEASP